MNGKRFFTVSVVCVFFVALAIFSMGFKTLVGPGRGWQSLPVALIVDRNGHPSIDDGDGGVSRTIDAINSLTTGWNSARPGIIAARAGNTGGGRQGDGTPTLNFTGSNVCVGPCIAVTFPLITSRAIVDSDTYVNDRVNFQSEGEPGGCTAEVYIEATMVHEIGHGLGLDHPPGKKWATMYAYITPCSNYQASLAYDDVRGIRYIY